MTLFKIIGKDEREPRSCAKLEELEICKNGQYVWRGLERFENDMKVSDQRFVNSDLLDCPECGCRNSTEILQFNEKKYEVTGFNNRNGCNANWKDTTGLYNCEIMSIYCYFDASKNEYLSSAFFPFDRYKDESGMTGWVCPACGCTDGILIFSGNNADVLSLNEQNQTYESVSAVEIYNGNYTSIGSCSAVIKEKRFFIGGKYHPRSIFVSEYDSNVCSLNEFIANSSFSFVDHFCTEADLVMNNEEKTPSVVICSPKDYPKMCFSFQKTDSKTVIRPFPNNIQLYHT